MNTAATDNISFGAMLRKVLVFCAPIISNSLLNILPSVASMWILARLGKDQLAAAAIATPTFYTIITIFITGFYAVGIKVGYCYGQDKHNPEIGQWVRNSLFLALLLSIPAMLILFNVHYFLLLVGQKPHLIKITESFFFFGAFSIIMMMVNSAINQYFSAIGHPKIALILSLITMPFVVGLAYILVLGKLGMPSLGLGGINCATFIVDTVLVLCSLMIMRRAKWSKPFAVLSRPVGITKRYCLDLIKLGWPISVQVSGELAGITAATYLLGLFGVSALAASQITGQYVLLFVMIAMGLSSGVAILTSQAHGKSNTFAIKQITRAAVIIISSFCAVFVIAFVVVPVPLIDFYLNSQVPHHAELVGYAKDFMMVAALYLAFDGVRNVLTGSLRGLHDSQVPMKIGIGCIWLLGLPCAYVAGFVLNGGPVMLRLGFAVGVVIATILLVVRYGVVVSRLRRR